MKTLPAILVSSASVLFVAFNAFADEPSKSQQIPLNGHTFTLPAGFDIELVAGPPLVDRPITADFDEDGRLYVSDSSGSNDNVDQQLKNKPHRILRLEDTDGDGKFDRRTVFADKMMFPEGTMWHAGSLYVAAPPSIWKLTDTDGDGVADQRLEWFQGKTLTGCANDLHGPYLGADGWIYWCKGAFARQTYERPGKPPFVTRAAHIFRCRPDGTGIEPVMTGGMDNPVDVVFTPGGERIFTTTFLQHPGGGKRDGLIHALYGGVYGKDHDVIYEHPWTGPAHLPPLTHLGPAAPCGLTRYESTAFGPDFKDNLFACNFNLHKITRHVLEPSGATFKTRDQDFLVSSNLDFHPTDVLADADGSLLVIDTGGWYKLCCPTSQLHKPDVLGGIYRIRKKDAPRLADPRGRKLPWATMSAKKLAGLLGDPRPAVRQRAVHTLAQKGAEALAPLAEVLSSAAAPEARRNAVWTATRLDLDDARALVRNALADTDDSVRQAALHSISVRRDSAALPALLKILAGSSAHNRRAAAEALGRIGDKSAVPALLQALEKPADFALQHSLIFALIEIGDADATAKGLKSSNAHVRRAAMIALDQMGGKHLDPTAVAAEFTASDPALREAAWWIAGRHPDWGNALAGFFRTRLAETQTPAQWDELSGQLARLARNPAIQQLLARCLADPQSSREARRHAVRAMGKSALKEAPPAWLPVFTQTLSSTDRELVSEAVSAVRALRLPKQGAESLIAVLLKIGSDSRAEPSLRLTALAAIPNGLSPVEPPLFVFLRSMLAMDQPPAARSLAAGVLGRSRLTSAQLVDLMQSLDSSGPMELERLLDAFAASTDEKVGQALIFILKKPELRPRLRVETLKPRLSKYPAPVHKQAEELYALLDVDGVKQRARLEEFLPLVKTGDIRRGQLVFHNTKAACASCHAIGYLGGNIGPDLTRIGSIRTERDLLEAILFPSASFVRSYEPVQVTTKDGKVFNGVIRSDAPDELLLALTADQQVRLSRSDIEDIQPSKVSIMPAGLEQQFTLQELADLVAFLKACR